MPTECEYKNTDCPYRFYHHNHGLRCFDDCAMRGALKFRENWENHSGWKETKQSLVANPLASIALNAACAPTKKRSYDNGKVSDELADYCADRM